MAEVGLPVYTVNVDAVTLAHKRVPPIEEFLMRSVAMSLSTIEELGAYLGLSQEVLKPALANLYQSENIALTALQGRQRWTLTAKGRATLESAEIVVPEQSTFPVHFDAILRKPTLFRFQTLLKYKDLKEEGLIEIEVYPPRRPQVEEISAADLERILKTIPMNSEQRRDVLAVRSLDSRSIKKAYLRAICLFFKSLEDDEKQLAFIIDGKQSQEHELAFAANEGFRRSLANLRSNDEKAELRVLTEGVEDAATTPQQLTAESDKLRAEASVAQVEGALESAPDEEKHVLRQKLQELEQQLSKAKEEADRFEVKNLYVVDHPPLLDDAISTAKSRLMIISPWVAGKVVTCSSARTSPVRHSSARSPNTYWLPRLASEPSRTAALAVRSQISRAISGVSRVSAGLPISLSTCWMRSSEMRLRNGDCSSCTARPCLSVPSNTASPVVLLKSARTIVSLSVSFGARRR